MLWLCAQRQRSVESVFVSDSGLKFIAPELMSHTALSCSSNNLASDDLSPAVDVYNFALLVIWVCYSAHTHSVRAVCR